MIAAAHTAYPGLSIRRLCAAVGAGRPWWYTRPPADAIAERDAGLRDAIERIVLEFPGYGYRRVAKALQRDGWGVNHKRVPRVMREEALLCQLERRFVRTTDAAHALRTYPNLLASTVLAGPDRTRPGWRTSPTSACRRPSPPSPASSMAGRGAASGGRCRGGSTRP